MKEVWKRLIYHGKDLGDYYLISNLGNLKNSKTCKIRKLRITNGYYYASISLGCKNNKPSIYIHRAVAETFIDNPNNYPIINHKDGNKLNNNVDNLEWCTQEYNVQHAIYNNLHNPRTSCKSIAQINKDTDEIINVFDSAKDAQLFLGIQKHTGTISDCIKGRIKTAYGYRWRLI